MNLKKLGSRIAGLALCLGMALSAAVFSPSLAASDTVKFQDFPSIEEVKAANGVNERYGPNTKEGYIRNKFLGYYQAPVEADGASTTLYYYTPDSCIISNPVVLAVLDEGADPGAFLQANAQRAEHDGIALMALTAPAEGWGENATALIAAAAARISPSAQIFNYYSGSNRTLVGYGKGATAVMRYLENGKNASAFSSAAIYDPVGYTFDKETATSEYVCPMVFSSGSYDDDQKAFVALFEGNNGGENISVVEKAAERYQLPEGLLGAFQRSGTGVLDAKLVRDEDDPEYGGLSLRTIEADGILRYYYIYTPESVRDSGEKVPVVLAMAGKSARYTDYLYSSGWLDIADEEGIVVAFPLASPDISVSVDGVYTALAWGRWDDTNFVQSYVVPDILDKDNGDPSRVYAFGHSSGCCMAIAQAVSSGDNGNPFAAVSGTGGWLGYWEPLGFATEEETYDTKGTLFVPQDDTGDGVYTMYEKNDRFDNSLQIPTYILYGETDTVMAWAMRTPAAQPGGPDFVNPGIVREFKFYQKHYNFGSDLRDMMNSAISFRDGEYSTYVFRNEDDIPMLRYEIVDKIGHVQTPDEARRAYNWFRNFTLTGDGVAYDGTVTDTGNRDVIQMDPYGMFSPAGTVADCQDVTANAWFYGSVKNAVENGWMSGTGSASFAPYAEVTRADVVLGLWHLAGEPVVCYVLPYEDVAKDVYLEAIRWAAKAGIVDAGTSFGPDSSVTREELISMLYRGSGSPASTGTLSAFSDAGKVSANAKSAMEWAVSSGIVCGTGAGELAPAGIATRAELATLLERLSTMN